MTDAVWPLHRNVTHFAWPCYLQVLAHGVLDAHTCFVLLLMAVAADAQQPWYKGAVEEGFYIAGYSHLSSVLSHVVGISSDGLNFIDGVDSLDFWLFCCIQLLVPMCVNVPVAGYALIASRYWF